EENAGYHCPLGSDRRAHPLVHSSAARREGFGPHDQHGTGRIESRYRAAVVAAVAEGAQVGGAEGRGPGALSCRREGAARRIERLSGPAPTNFRPATDADRDEVWRGDVINLGTGQSDGQIPPCRTRKEFLRYWPDYSDQP